MVHNKDNKCLSEERLKTLIREIFRQELEKQQKNLLNLIRGNLKITLKEIKSTKTERIFNNLIKQNQKLASDFVLKQSTIVSSAQSPKCSIQRPASRVQRPASRVQQPTLASRVQEFRYAESKRPGVHSPSVQTSRVQASRVQESRVQASRRPEFKCPESKRLESKRPSVQSSSVQSPSVYSPSVQTMRPRSSFFGMPTSPKDVCISKIENVCSSELFSMVMCVLSHKCAVTFEDNKYNLLHL